MTATTETVTPLSDAATLLARLDNAMLHAQHADAARAEQNRTEEEDGPNPGGWEHVERLTEQFADDAYDALRLIRPLLAALASTPEPGTLTATVTDGDLGDDGTPVPVATVEHAVARVAVYPHQSSDDGLVLVVDVDTLTDDPTDLRVYVNDAPIYRQGK